MKKNKNREPIRNQKKALVHAFPGAYIANGFNGTKAYQQLKPHVSKDTARAEAPTILAIPSVQERIRALLPSEEVESEVIRNAINTPATDPMTWRDKHKYLTTSLQLKGLLKNNDTSSSNVNVGIIIER